MIALHVLNRANQEHQRNVHLEPQALAWLEQQPWPGNIRELGNLIERSVLLSESARVSVEQLRAWAQSSSEGSDRGSVCAPDSLDAASSTPEPILTTQAGREGAHDGSRHFDSYAPSGLRDYRSINSHSAQALREALDRHAGNQSRAARALGLTPRQFAYRWRRHASPVR